MVDKVDIAKAKYRLVSFLIQKEFNAHKGKKTENKNRFVQAIFPF